MSVIFLILFSDLIPSDLFQKSPLRPSKAFCFLPVRDYTFDAGRAKILNAANVASLKNRTKYGDGIKKDPFGATFTLVLSVVLVFARFECSFSFRSF